MARTVPASLTPPARYAVARVPIIDDDGTDRGLLYHAETVNGLYEYQRGSVIHDIGGFLSGPILNAQGEIVYYRTKNLGYGGLSDEGGVAALSAIIEDLSDSDPTQAEITVTSGASSATWNYSTDLGSLSPFIPEFVEIDGFNIPDSAEYSTTSVEITSDGQSGDVSIAVYGVSMGYARDKTALTAGAYTNGFIPHEASAYANGRPVSTQRLIALHENAQNLYENRVGQIVASAWAAGSYRTDDVWAIQRIPHTADGATLTARFHIRCAKTSGASSTTASVRAYMTSPDNGVASSILSVTSTTHDWKVADLSISTPRFGDPARYAFFKVTGTNLSVSSFCGWWRDRTYG